MMPQPHIAGMSCQYRDVRGVAAYHDLLAGQINLAGPMEKLAGEDAGLDEVETELAIALTMEALYDADDHLHGVDRSEMGLWVARARQRPGRSAGGLIAPRIARSLNLRGPIVDVDMECASALAAVAAATAALTARQCRIATVVAVRSASTAAEIGELARSGVLSPRGSCRPFDRQADGYAPAEGGGAIVLSAEGGPDIGYGVVTGAATGFISSPVPGFAIAFEPLRDFIKSFADRYSLCETIGYIEAHALGSRVGDELEALAFAEALKPSTPIGIGSLKHLVGHLEAASGMAALQKLALMARYGLVPATRRSHDLVPFLNDRRSCLIFGGAGNPWVESRPNSVTAALGQSGAIALVALCNGKDVAPVRDAATSRLERARPSLEIVDAARSPAVISILADTLGCVDEIAQDVSFFEIGMDSLKAAQIAQRLSSELALTVSPATLFKNHRLASLVSELAVVPRAEQTDPIFDPEPRAARVQLLKRLILAEPDSPNGSQ